MDLSNSPPSQKSSLLSLVERLESGQIEGDSQKLGQILALIFTHQQIISSLKNQNQIIKKIFTYSNLQTLIGYLEQQNKDHIQLLKTIQYDPSGSTIPQCMKLPFMAMQILCCECQQINDLLFIGSAQNESPLLPNLLSFLDHSQHYHLASFFSRVICAITKRVSSTSHKYNPKFAQWIFGKDESQQQIVNSSLFKSINHLYSLTTIEYLTKWLLISSKTKVKEEDNGEIFEKTIVNFRKKLKHRFLLELIDRINKQDLNRQCLNNIPKLFEQILTHSEKSNKLTSSLMIKSLPMNNAGSTGKITLYQLATREQIISGIFRAPQKGCLSIAKIQLIKVYLSCYLNEFDLLKKDKEDDVQQELKLLQIINFENLTSLIDWIFEQLNSYMNLSTISNIENSSFNDKQPIDQSRVSLTSYQKMIILYLLEVLKLTHSLPNFRAHLIEYYNINSRILAKLTKRLMKLENNLIQIQTSKIVMIMLSSKEKGKDCIPYDFARKLLTITILQLLQINSAREHVIRWANIAISLEREHIFEDYQEEFEWDHIREIVEQEKKLNVGQFRLIQSNIDHFYSQENAQLKYSTFLNDFKPEIIYQDKKDNLVSQKKLYPKKQSQKLLIEQDQVQLFQAIPLAYLQLNGNYLQFNVNQLMQQL